MYNLLIAEDEKFARNHLEKFVKNNLSEYYNVYTAKNGDEALNFIENNEVDVVVTDIRMPGMSGIELSKIIYENYKYITVMIISGYEEFEYAKKAIRYNVKEYFVKPFDLNEFKNALIKTASLIDEEKNDFNSSNTYSEEAECFFFSLIYGGIKNIDEARNQAKILSLPFDIETTPCDFILLEIDGYNKFLNEKWSYTKDSFNIAVYNLLSGFLKTDYAYCIHSENGQFEYIIYHNECNFNYDDVALKMSNIINLPVTVIVKHPLFQTFDELFEYGSENENADEKGTSFMISEKDEKNQEAMELAKKYIEENYHKNISREDVAGAVFFSPVYFAKNFKAYTGINYNDYLLKIRMEKAIELMKQNKYKIYEIAKKTGYENTKYFFRVFKLYTGYTPKDYIIKFSSPDNKETE